MKTYEQLTEEQQEKAREKALGDLITAVLEGLRFNDELNKETFQTSIDAAGEKADEMQTPWFTAEYIMEATYTSEYMEGEQSTGEHLRSMAQCDAEDAMYPEPDEHCVSGIAE